MVLRPGILRPCFNDGYLKMWIILILKTWIGLFVTTLRNHIYFQDIGLKYLWRRLQRRPLGAAAPGGDDMFSKTLKIDPLFQNILTTKTSICSKSV